MQKWVLFEKELVNLDFFMSIKVHSHDIEEYWCLKCSCPNRDYRLLGKFASEESAYEFLKKLHNY